MATKDETIEVKAAPGIPVHFPIGTKAAPGRTTFVLQGEETCTVRKHDVFVMKRLRAGDLLMVKTEVRESASDTDAETKTRRRTPAKTEG